MLALTNWVSNIIILLILALILDMILPNSDLKKYAKLTTGLLLIVMIISPIFKVLSSDFDQVLKSLTEAFEYDDQEYDNSLEMKKSEIQASQHAYILEQQAVLMKKDVEKELIDRFNMEIQSIQLTSSINADSIDDQLQSVKVHVTHATDTTEVIKPINIDLNESERKETSLDNEALTALLSARWEIPQSIIEIVARGGPE